MQSNPILKNQNKITKKAGWEGDSVFLFLLLL